MLSQEEQGIAAQQLRDFVAEYAGERLQSTSATPVNYAGVLYNIDGSSRDPKIGASWKALLLHYAIGGNCYATSPLPTEQRTHPAFNVGGHMTPNANGQVVTGGQCYLMPLCSWHNSKKRDFIPFPHAMTQMLLLSGYNQLDSVATFLARMPTEAPLSLVFIDADGLSYRHIADEPDAVAKTLDADPGPSTAESGPYVLLRQHTDGDTVTYTIEDSRV